MTMSFEDCMCPICMCILVEPVTMSCQHTLCYPCFKQNVEEASLTCPMCRTRISVWARRASKKGTLINKKLWHQIQKLFPDKVEKRQKGLDDDDEDRRESVFQPMISIAEPGEIRKEYEEQLKRLAEQRAEEQKKEMEASEALIKKLEEEEAERRDREQRDRELAQEINRAVNENESTDESVTIFNEESRRRQTRSVSTTSSCSATSSRPPSTIDSFLKKMQKAEKLKAEDEQNRKNLSPYPYKCYSPTQKGKSNGSETVSRCLSSRGLSSRGLSSRSCTSGSDLYHSDIEDEDVPSKYVSFSISDESLMMGNLSDTKNDGMSFDNECVEVLERCDSAESVDSISQEISHFRPIRVCPLTPPRKLPSGKVIEPPLIRTTPRNLNKCEFGSPVKTPVRTLAELDASSPIVQRRLSELEEERKCNVNKFSKSTNTETKNKKVVVNDHDYESSLSRTNGTDHDYSAVVVDLEVLSDPESPEITDREKENPKKTNFTINCSESSCVSSENDSNQANKYLMPEQGYKIRKLVIPLEPTFDENDDFDIPPLQESKICNIRSDSAIVSGSEGPVAVSHGDSTSHRKRKLNNQLSRKTKNSLMIPQRSITDWIVKSPGCESVKSTFHLEDTCRDDVDGELHSSKEKHSKKDKTVSKNKVKVVKSYPKRIRKPYSDGDFLCYFDKKNTTFKTSVDPEESDTSSFVDSEVNYVLPKSSKSRLTSSKRPKSSLSQDEHPPKKRKLTDKQKGIPKLKVNTTKAKLKSVKHSRVTRTGQSLLGFHMNSKLHNLKESEFSLDPGVMEFNDDSFDKNLQELEDRKLAEKLSEQFEMEAKLNTQFFKWKGSSEDYNFRRKPKMSV